MTIEKILLTHGHIDHCGSAGILAEELGVPIEGPHEDDLFWISRLRGRRRNATASPASRSSPTAGWTTATRSTVGELTFDVRHCPGHTPGHVVFHHPESKLAIVGDVLFKGSIGRWDFPMRQSPAADRLDHRSGCGRWATTPPSSPATARCRPSPTSARPIRFAEMPRWRPELLIQWHPEAGESGKDQQPESCGGPSWIPNENRRRFRHLGVG